MLDWFCSVEPVSIVAMVPCQTCVWSTRERTSTVSPTVTDAMFCSLTLPLMRKSPPFRIVTSTSGSLSPGFAGSDTVSTVPSTGAVTAAFSMSAFRRSSSACLVLML